MKGGATVGGAPRDPARLLKEALSPGLRRRLDTVREAAANAGAAVWLVGGPVRDLMLGHDVVDLDIAVRGDVPALAGAVAARGGGRVHGHVRFGTASVRFDDGVRVDLAVIRRERYVRPGALPEIEPADAIEEDLWRRDFGINAMALDIGAQAAPEIVDPCGGRQDLEAGRIRVLHERSFRDDPTRILRALRFSGRFGYPLEAMTETQLRDALQGEALETVSGIRLGSEVRALLKEPSPVPCLLAADRAELWSYLPPSGLHSGGDVAERYARASDALSWFRELTGEASLPELEGWVVYWLVLAEGNEEAMEGTARFLELGEKAVRASADVGRRGSTVSHFLERPYHGSDSALHAALSGLAPESLVAMLARSGSSGARRRLERFFTVLCPTRPFLDGNDLLAMGVGEGPRIGEFLQRLFAAQLDGLVGSREEALEEARRLMEEPEAG